MNRVLVLMSAYNGEAYIREQLDSIIRQEERADILVRDDGSDDLTKQILAEYEHTYSNITVIYGENIGVVKSFFQLLEHAKGYDYYAFSDQDDVWMSDKLSCACKALDRMDRRKPCLYASCSLLVDSALQGKETTQICRRDLSFFNVIIQNIMPGHTQVFNQAMVDFVLAHPADLDHVVVHDFWFSLLAITFGTVAFDNTPHTYYRQHTSNQIGYGHGPFGWFSERLRRVIHAKAKEITVQDEMFYSMFADQLAPQQRKELDALLHSQRNIFTRFNYLIHAHVYRQRSLETLLFYILYLLGGYKI